MPAKQLFPLPVPRQWQSFIRRIRTRLRANDLLSVLDSLPAVTSFSFYEAITSNKKAIMVDIGYRAQVEEVLAQSWAYVLLDSSDITPPVLFRDEVPSAPGNNGRSKIFPRAATSLVRSAGALLRPFSFLQIDSDCNATNVRGMVCSLVAYYALTSGLSDCAVGWSEFESNLILALEYIGNRMEYRQWVDKLAEVSIDTRDEHVPCADEAQIDDKSDTRYKANAGDIDHDNMEEEVGFVGLIRSSGSILMVQPGSTLAKFRNALGTKVSLLDAIPATPVTIERQDLYPSYFPYRLHIGSYLGCKVYVYPTHDAKGTMKLIAHGLDGEELPSWTFLDLSPLDLIDPFNIIMRYGNNDLRTRGHKIRYLVSYYFMLAENAGLTGDPRVQATSPSMLAAFCSACNNFDTINQSKNKYATQPVSAEEPKMRAREGLRTAASDNQRTQYTPEAIKKSLISKVTLRPDLLAKIDGTATFSRCDKVLSSGNEKGKQAFSAGQHQPSQRSQSSSSAFVVEKSMGFAERGLRGDENVKQPQLHLDDTLMEDTQDAPVHEDDNSQCKPRGSENAISFALSAVLGLANPDPRIHLTAEFGPSDDGSINTARIKTTEDDKAEPLETLSHMVGDLIVVENDKSRSRKLSVISIDSASDAQESHRGVVSASAVPDDSQFLSVDPLRRPRESVRIDLSSDDEDSVIAKSPKLEAEGSPAGTEVMNSYQQQHQLYQDKELRPWAQSGLSGNVQVLSDDDDMLEEADGYAWNKAKQTKQRLSSHEMWRNWE